mgnify:CR=1 FL=1
MDEVKLVHQVCVETNGVETLCNRNLLRIETFRRVSIGGVQVGLSMNMEWDESRGLYLLRCGRGKWV